LRRKEIKSEGDELERERSSQCGGLTKPSALGTNNHLEETI